MPDATHVTPDRYALFHKHFRRQVWERDRSSRP